MTHPEITQNALQRLENYLAHLDWANDAAQVDEETSVDFRLGDLRALATQRVKHEVVLQRLTEEITAMRNDVDAVEALLAEAREVIAPFAKVGGYMRNTPGVRSASIHYNAVESDGLNSRGSATLFVGDYRRAAAFLERTAK